MNYNLETFSQKYDNELDVYRLMVFEMGLINSSVFDQYFLETSNNFFKISSSIKRNISKRKEIADNIFDKFISQYIYR